MYELGARRNAGGRPNTEMRGADRAHDMPTTCGVQYIYAEMREKMSDEGSAQRSEMYETECAQKYTS